MKKEELFKGLTVVELSSVLAGPLACSFFAELGAKVIKIENKLTKGDVTRHWIHPKEQIKEGTSDYYQAANTDKEVIMLDLGDSKDYEVLKNYVVSADVVIANFLPTSARKLKCDYESLSLLNESIIYANLTAYTSQDDRPGFDLLMQASCGYVAMNGTIGHLAKMPTAMIDILAGHQLKEAVLVALIQQAKGIIKGCELSVSLYGSALTGLINQASSSLNSGITPSPKGTLHPTIAPYGDLFTSRDNTDFMLAIGTDAQFTRLANCIELDQDTTTLLSGNQVRVNSRDHLQTVLQAKFGLLDYQQICQALNEYRIPFAPINTVPQTLASDEAQSYIVTLSNGLRRITEVAWSMLRV